MSGEPVLDGLMSSDAELFAAAPVLLPGNPAVSS